MSSGRCTVDVIAHSNTWPLFYQGGLEISRWVALSTGACTSPQTASREQARPVFRPFRGRNSFKLQLAMMSIKKSSLPCRRSKQKQQRLQETIPVCELKLILLNQKKTIEGRWQTLCKLIQLRPAHKTSTASRHEQHETNTFHQSRPRNTNDTSTITPAAPLRNQPGPAHPPLPQQSRQPSADPKNHHSLWTPSFFTEIGPLSQTTRKISSPPSERRELNENKQAHQSIQGDQRTPIVDWTPIMELECIPTVLH